MKWRQCDLPCPSPTGAKGRYNPRCAEHQGRCCGVLGRLVGVWWRRSTTRRREWKRRGELGRVQQLESQQKAIEQELYDGTLYTTNAKRAAELNARNTKIEEELMTALQRWETLSS